VAALGINVGVSLMSVTERQADAAQRQPAVRSLTAVLCSARSVAAVAPPIGIR